MTFMYKLLFSPNVNQQLAQKSVVNSHYLIIFDYRIAESRSVLRAEKNEEYNL